MKNSDCVLPLHGGQWSLIFTSGLISGLISRQLLSAEVNLISTELCNSTDYYNGLIDDSMVCAGTFQGGVDSCKVSGGSVSEPALKIYY